MLINIFVVRQHWRQVERSVSKVVGGRDSASMAASASLGERPQVSVVVRLVVAVHFVVTECVLSRKDYEVFELLGKGGFAQVFRARCRLTGATVALKKIDKALMASKGMESRVRQEVLIHSKLKHPAVLELLAFFEDKHYVYLALELAHNGELARFFAPSAAAPGGLSEAAAARILRQIVDGVLYLHSHRIIHRDLSLNNLLLTRDFQVVSYLVYWPPFFIPTGVSF